MKKLDFNKEWKFHKENSDVLPKIVHLPHDAMFYEKRSAENTAGLGYYPGGTYIYEKLWTVPKDYEGKTVLLEFEGVYRHARVLVNEEEAGYWAYGYTRFYIDLTPYVAVGETIKITVIADNSKQPNSRWYSGSGIYRKVNLWVGEKACIRPEAVKITTSSLAPAKIQVSVTLPEELLSDTGNQVLTEILYGGELVAKGQGMEAELEIPDARLWSDETPELYLARVKLLDRSGRELDRAKEQFGIRQLSWDAKSGFMVNGKTVLLRGGCIHHDNGVIGACAFADAEERKVRIMKEAGFNAIRSAHNPCSKELLSACDKYGMYVMDETFDSWYIPKNSKDYAIDFDEWYEKDIRAMVEKDYNHPSVIMYSIGNEVIETAQKRGIKLAESMCGLIRSMDNTRPVTCGISITQNIDEYQGNKSAKEQHMGGIEKKEDAGENAGTQEQQADPAQLLAPEALAQVNQFMEKLGWDNEQKANTKEAEDALHEVALQLDIPGYNYGEEKWHYDTVHFPERVVVHSETHHTQLYEHWELIKQKPHIIGDFMWVGWDHLGEAGIGALGYPDRGIGFDKPYPCLTSGCGIIDITGFRRPEAYLAKMIWGLQKQPVIAVEPVEYSGKPYMINYWNDTEGVSGWSWPGLEGKLATVKVYGIGKEAELFVNGESAGLKALDKYTAVFETPYTPGTVSAVIYDTDGKEASTAEICTPKQEEILTVTADKTEVSANGQDLVYLEISLTDEAGNIHVYPDREIQVEVSGAGSLQGLGSGAIFTEDSFVNGHCHTFHGRALAVIRAGYEPGEIKVTVSCGELCQIFRCKTRSLVLS